MKVDTIRSALLSEAERRELYGCSGFDTDGVPTEEVSRWDGGEDVSVDSYSEVDGTFVQYERLCFFDQIIDDLLFSRWSSKKFLQIEVPDFLKSMSILKDVDTEKISKKFSFEDIEAFKAEDHLAD